MNQSIEKNKKSLFYISIILRILLLGIIYYVLHPTINFSSFSFWIYLWLTSFLFIDTILRFIEKTTCNINHFIYIAILLFMIPIVLWFMNVRIFHAEEYSNRINIEQQEFNNETLKEVDFSKTPIIDRDSTIKLGDKVMGEMPELVSQFEVSEEYTQISYKNSVYRVTPLEYAGFIKYLTNKDEGIPAYITVNSTNGETNLVKLKDLGLEGMKYVPSGYFNNDLQRKLQLDYPNIIFGSPSFEIDEEGHPWYVCTTYGYKAIGAKKHVTGMILFDPITGDSTKYEEGNFPDWVDRIYPEDLIMTEIEDNGSLKDGFINSVIGQKNVTKPSDGYNYLEKNGDIWIYTGITSANSDASNLGFVLTNLRTHESIKFSCSGANEQSAMESAEGEVKNYGYHSTFPLLVNINNNPVYLMSLKDDGGLVKQYAMVDAKDYQKVSVYSADSIKNLELLKKQFISSKNIEDSSDNSGILSKEITVKEYIILNSDGKSKVFITDTENNKYKLTVTASNENIIAFLQQNQKLQIAFVENEEVNIIKSIE